MKMILTALLTITGLAWAQAPQAPNPTQQLTESSGGPAPLYRITVVARTTKAINYNHRSGSTRIGFQGTALMPAAAGEAKVESKQGVIKIDAEMQQLGPATAFGPEYLTYVMWATRRKAALPISVKCCSTMAKANWTLQPSCSPSG